MSTPAIEVANATMVRMQAMVQSRNESAKFNRMNPNDEMDPEKMKDMEIGSDFRINIQIFGAPHVAFSKSVGKHHVHNAPRLVFGSPLSKSNRFGVIPCADIPQFRGQCIFVALALGAVLNTAMRKDYQKKSADENLWQRRLSHEFAFSRKVKNGLLRNKSVQNKVYGLIVILQRQWNILDVNGTKEGPFNLQLICETLILNDM